MFIFDSKISNRIRLSWLQAELWYQLRADTMQWQLRIIQKI